MGNVMGSVSDDGMVECVGVRQWEEASIVG